MRIGSLINWAINSIPRAAVLGAVGKATGAFTGDGTKVLFEMPHNLGDSSVIFDIRDANLQKVLLDTPPKSGSETSIGIASFSVAPANGAVFYWTAIG